MTDAPVVFTDGDCDLVPSLPTIVFDNDAGTARLTGCIYLDVGPNNLELQGYRFRVNVLFRSGHFHFF